MYTFSETLQAAIAAGNRQRCLLEFVDESPVVTFSNEDIMINDGIQVSSTFNGETDLTVGGCPSTEIRFSLRNDQSQLANFGFGKFNAWLGAQITSGTPASGAKTATFTENGITALYEFAPIGVFVADRPNVVRTNTIRVNAHDQMTLFDVDMPDKTALGITYGNGTTLATLLTKMCQYAGVTLKSSNFLNNDIQIKKEPDVFESSTMREVLGLIAEAACSFARFDRNGELEIVWFNQTTKVYDEHKYSDVSQYWYETEAIDKLHIRNADSTTELKIGSGTNAYLIQDNPFLRQSGSA